METTLIAPVGDQIHRRGNVLTKAVSAFLMLLTGWRFEGQLPNLRKFVLIVAPHTSNWDFPVGVMAMFALGIRGTFLGKDTLFKPPFGFIFRWLGGVPVDRFSKNNVVDQTIALFKARDQMILAISPEGTRKVIERWRTGFYWVAVGAKVPIVPVAFDFPRKRYIIHAPQEMTGDPERDIAHLRSFFRASQAYRPAWYVE
ncbi:MAG: lysophospholipid acyltransferase family protein [Gemmatimonadetes bacterium]|nr:lysophospholipid acyltransferase family protein [Gemmatimonadota bacterium]